MLYKNPLNGSVAVNNLNPQYQAARSASFSVDGAQYSSPVNGPIKVAGYELNLVNTGAATISATQDASIVLRSVNNFINSYNQAIGTMNQTAMSGGAIAENLKMQEIYSEMVRFFNSPPPASFNGTRSLSDVGVTQSDSKPTSIQETVLAQLASKETGNNFSANSANSLSEYFPSGQGILSLIHQSGSNGVNSPDNFKMTVDSAKLRDSLLKNPAGTGAMLDYAASRLQSRLDVHLQPGYGTLAFQKKITGYYANNQQVVASLMSNVVGISTNNFNSGNTKTLLGSI
jgi:flagellar capping protein FliD